jgi:hypothetical protein
MGVEEKPFLSLTIAASAAGTTDQIRRRERYHIESRGTSASQLWLAVYQKLRRRHRPDRQRRDHRFPSLKSVLSTSRETLPKRFRRSMSSPGHAHSPF